MLQTLVLLLLLSSSAVKMPRGQTQESPADSDAFASIDNLLHPSAIQELPKGRWKALARQDLFGASLAGDAVSSSGEINKEILLNAKNKEEVKKAVRIGEMSRAMQYFSDRFLQGESTRLVSERLVPHTPNNYVPEGRTTWQDAINAPPGEPLSDGNSSTFLPPRTHSAPPQHCCNVTHLHAQHCSLTHWAEAPAIDRAQHRGQAAASCQATHLARWGGWHACTTNAQAMQRTGSCPVWAERGSRALEGLASRCQAAGSIPAVGLVNGGGVD